MKYIGRTIAKVFPYDFRGDRKKKKCVVLEFNGVRFLAYRAFFAERKRKNKHWILVDEKTKSLVLQEFFLRLTEAAYYSRRAITEQSKPVEYYQNQRIKEHKHITANRLRHFKPERIF